MGSILGMWLVPSCCPIGLDVGLGCKHFLMNVSEAMLSKKTLSPCWMGKDLDLQAKATHPNG